jgi:tRNA A-37 threonylcarbamoyl transferase component Bud32
MEFDMQELIESRAREPFLSRKNTVFPSVLNGGPVVVKVFAKDTASRALKERAVLERCFEKGVSVPGVIAYRDNTLVMEFVEGETLSDALDCMWLTESLSGEESRSRLDSIAKSLGVWLASFHGAFDYSMRRGDAIARNFILSPKGMTGIDFEESSESDVIDDVGEICSSVLSMHPMFTVEKTRFCKEIANSYFAASGSQRMKDLESAVPKAMRRYASFREDGGLLLKKADDIDRNGLWSVDD